MAEIDKLLANSEQTQAVSEFLDWAATQGMHLLEEMKWWEYAEPVFGRVLEGPPAPHGATDWRFTGIGRCNHTRHPVEAHWCQDPSDSKSYGRYYEETAWVYHRGTINGLLARWIGLDQMKLEQERRAVLEEVRQRNAQQRHG